MAIALVFCAFAIFTALASPLAVHAQDMSARYGCAAGDKACISRAAREHPAHKLSSWSFDPATPLAQRVQPAPPMLLEYLELDNLNQGFAEKPRAPAADAAFMRDLHGAIADLPPQVVRLVQPKLVGIFLVDDLGGTGYGDVVFDDQGKPSAYLVLDAAVLAKHTANAWATWKENTPFKPDPAWQLKARIEPPETDDRRGAIRYILLHELGHIVTVGTDIHPPWWVMPREVPGPPDPKFPFFDLSWSFDRANNTYVPLAAHDFPQRRRVVYYLGAKLEGAEMLPAYDALERTNFPTLYAATRPGDDFAEAFVKYVHVRLLGKPWDITLARDGREVRRVESCWGRPRCADKERYLQRLLASPQ